MFYQNVQKYYIEYKGFIHYSQDMPQPLYMTHNDLVIEVVHPLMDQRVLNWQLLHIPRPYSGIIQQM